jgi:hypothetical protein
LVILTDIYLSGNIHQGLGIVFFGFYGDLCAIFGSYLLISLIRSAEIRNSQKACNFKDLVIRIKNGAQAGAVSIINYATKVT